LKQRRGHLEKKYKRTLIVCNRKGGTLGREGRAAAHQEQAEPSPMSQLLRGSLHPNHGGVARGKPVAGGMDCDLTGAFS